MPNASLRFHTNDNVVITTRGSSSLYVALSLDVSFPEPAGFPERGEDRSSQQESGRCRSVPLEMDWPLARDTGFTPFCESSS